MAASFGTGGTVTYGRGSGPTFSLTPTSFGSTRMVDLAAGSFVASGSRTTESLGPISVWYANRGSGGGTDLHRTVEAR